MSDKIYNMIERNGDFEVDKEYIDSLIRYSIASAISDLGYYWRQNSLAEKLINDNSFNYLWSDYESLRKQLLSLAESSAMNDNERNNYGISREFSLSFIEELYNKTPIDMDEENNSLRAKLAYIVDGDFDYLAQICEYSIDPSHDSLYLLWRKMGMAHSKDGSFYDYLFSKVKREVGSTDTKVSIVEAAFSRGALSDVIIRKVAKSSPKKLKRTVVSLLSESLQGERRSLDREANQEKIAARQKIVDKIEARVMLFVSCDDNEIVSNLIDSLSEDNLPWLMPSASKHPWLSRRLQQKIDHLSER